jgi:hypothetical protein
VSNKWGEVHPTPTLPKNEKNIFGEGEEIRRGGRNSERGKR